jgi:hypothetical protein
MVLGHTGHIQIRQDDRLEPSRQVGRQLGCRMLAHAAKLTDIHVFFLVNGFCNANGG